MIMLNMLNYGLVVTRACVNSTKGVGFEGQTGLGDLTLNELSPLADAARRCSHVHSSTF